MHESETTAWLRERLVLYNALRHAYLQPPSLSVAAMLQELEVDAVAAPVLLREGLALMRSRAEPAALASIAEEYARLFVGPGTVAVPPFESCYRSSDPLVMQEVTTQVRRAYLDAGLVPQRLYAEPDDHIGTEWEFVYAVTARALEADTTRDTVQVRVWLNRRERFLRAHLLQWLPAFCGRLQQATTESYFLGLAVLTRAITDLEEGGLGHDIPAPRFAP